MQMTVRFVKRSIVLTVYFYSVYLMRFCLGRVAWNGVQCDCFNLYLTFTEGVVQADRHKIYDDITKGEKIKHCFSMEYGFEWAATPFH